MKKEYVYRVGKKHALGNHFERLRSKFKTFFFNNNRLARALYRKADIYLLDDPFNTVDYKVSKHLFDECIGPKGFLAKNGSTRILITHRPDYIQKADHVITLKDVIFV